MVAVGLLVDLLFETVPDLLLPLLLELLMLLVALLFVLLLTELWTALRLFPDLLNPSVDFFAEPALCLELSFAADLVEAVEVLRA